MTSTDNSECFILDHLLENNYQQVIHNRRKSTDVFITNNTETAYSNGEQTEKSTPVKSSAISGQTTDTELR